MQRELFISAVLYVALGAANTSLAQDKNLDFENESTRVNYSLGFQIGGDFLRQGVEMDADAVVQGIADALVGRTPRMRQDEMSATMVALKQKVVTQERQKRQATEIARIKEGEVFLAENAGKDGVITTDSGLQYRIIEPGSGAIPGLTDRITVNYRGTLVNGNEFDSGEDVSFSLNGVIPGWTEGLQLIKEGGRIELFIPSKIAYQDRGPLANRTLIFDVSLVSIKPTEVMQGDKGGN